MVGNKSLLISAIKNRKGTIEITPKDNIEMGNNLDTLIGDLCDAKSNNDLHTAQKIRSEIQQKVSDYDQKDIYLHTILKHETSCHGKYEMPSNNSLLLSAIATEEYDIAEKLIDKASCVLTSEEFKAFSSYQFESFETHYSKMWINTALTLLANRGQYQLIDKLIDYDANLNGHNEHGLSVLSILVARLPLENEERYETLLQLITKISATAPELWNMEDLQNSQPIKYLEHYPINICSYGDEIVSHVRDDQDQTLLHQRPVDLIRTTIEKLLPAVQPKVDQIPVAQDTILEYINQNPFEEQKIAGEDSDM